LAKLDVIVWTNGINAMKRDLLDHFLPDNSKHMDSPVIIAALAKVAVERDALQIRTALQILRRIVEGLQS
jgi:hypothetical protein